jgi:hypothetical protein
MIPRARLPWWVVDECVQDHPEGEVNGNGSKQKLEQEKRPFDYGIDSVQPNEPAHAEQHAPYQTCTTQDDGPNSLKTVQAFRTFDERALKIGDVRYSLNGINVPLSLL